MFKQTIGRATRLLLIGALSASIALSANAQESATKAASHDAFVDKSIQRTFAESAKKGTDAKQRVIVNFETARGRNVVTPSQVEIANARSSVLSRLPAGSFTTISDFSHIPAISLEVNSAALQALRSNPLVHTINEDTEVFPYMIQANAVTGADTIHAGGLTGDGVVVAVIDSGVDSDHPALVNDMVGQRCFRTEGDCPGGETSAEDQGGHGTHVTGMITGPNGVAPSAKFHALKVFTTGSTSTTNIINALNYVIANPQFDIRLVNMSLGGGSFGTQAACDTASAAYVSAFATLNAAGVTVFVATGNDALIGAVGSPACATGAVAVGSTGDAVFNLSFANCTDNGQPDKLSCFSNGHPLQGPGQMLDLVAPGCFITSTGLNGSVTYNNCGTSMATPYALGVAALVLEFDDAGANAMTPALLEQHLKDTGVPVTDYRMTAPNNGPFPRVSPTQAIGALSLDPPANFAITGVTATTASMSWDAVAGATEYRIYRESAGDPAIVVGTVTDPTITFTDTDAACGELTYFVRAYDGQFETLPSNSDSDTARDCPAQPTTLALTEIDADSIQLDWTDNATDETGYIVERAAGGSGFTVIATLAAGVETYQDDTVACGLNVYRVAAVRGDDLSAYSNQVEFAACAPANDLFANALVVSAAATPTTPQFIANEPLLPLATESAGDPNYSCKFGGAAPGFHGIWYSVTPSEAVRLSVTTTGSTGAINDTLVSILTESGGVFTEVACNDDISGTNYLSTLAATLNAGTTYYVFVSAWEPLAADAIGNLRTTFTFSAPLVAPPHDLFANAKVIGTNVYNDTVPGMQNATVTAGDPGHTCRTNATGSHNVWYSFTPGTNGVIQNIDTVGSSGSMGDTVLSVLTGTYGGFTSVGCNDDGTGIGLASRLTNIPVTAGTTYTIYISRYSATPTTADGTLQLNFLFEPSAPVDVPEIAVAPAALSETLAAGGSSSQSLTISNNGTATLNWSIAEAESVGRVYAYNGASTSVAPQGHDRSSGVTPTGATAAQRIDAAPLGMIGSFDEGFADITLLPGAGWAQINNSNPLGTTGWFQGNPATFPAQQGETNAYIGANFNNTTGGTGTISNWLITPEVALQNGTTLSFWTRVPVPGATAYPDRLEVRLSTSGASTNVGGTATSVGDFTTLMLTINPALGANYPTGWSQYTVTVGDLPFGGATSGRFAFRYFVTNGGPDGVNSNYIGIDTVSVSSPQICDAPSDVSWLSATPAAGTTAAGDDSDVTVSFDAAGLASGDYEATLCISSDDPANPLVTVPVSLTVEAGPSVVIDVAPASIPDGTFGSSYEATFTASGDGSTAPFSFAVVDGVLPDGLTLSTSGTLAGTPSMAGSFTFTVAGTDDSAAPGPYSGEREYTVDIAQASQSIDFAELADRVISAAAFTVTADADSGLAISFASDTPTVCGVNGDEVTLLDLGTCTVIASQPGDNNWLAAADVAQSFEVLDVVVSIDPETLPNSQIGANYEQTLTAFGVGTSGSFTFALESGDLPTGLELSAAGVLSGTTIAVGEFTFVVSATDDSAAPGPYAGTREYTVAVRPDEVFSDGFENEVTPGSIELGNDGIKSIAVPLLDALAARSSDRVVIAATLLQHGERVGLVQARCGADACEARVLRVSVDGSWQVGTWSRVVDEPLQLQINLSKRQLIDVQNSID